MNRDFDGADEDEKEFYFWVGRVIKVWAEFDDALFGLWAVLLRPHYDKAGELYWRISSLDTRISNVSALVDLHLQPQPIKSGAKPPPDVKAWKGMLDRATGLLPYRNFIAHAPRWTSYEPGDWLPNGKRIVTATMHSRAHRVELDRRRKKKDLGPSDAKAMKVHTEDVIALAEDIRAFAVKLEKLLLEYLRQQVQLERASRLAGRSAKG